MESQVPLVNRRRVGAAMAAAIMLLGLMYWCSPRTLERSMSPDGRSALILRIYEGVFDDFVTANLVRDGKTTEIYKGYGDGCKLGFWSTYWSEDSHIVGIAACGLCGPGVEPVIAYDVSAGRRVDPGLIDRGFSMKIAAKYRPALEDLREDSALYWACGHLGRDGKKIFESSR